MYLRVKEMVSKCVFSFIFEYSGQKLLVVVGVLSDDGQHLGREGKSIISHCPLANVEPRSIQDRVKSYWDKPFEECCERGRTSSAKGLVSPCLQPQDKPKPPLSCLLFLETLLLTVSVIRPCEATSKYGALIANFPTTATSIR